MQPGIFGVGIATLSGHVIQTIVQSAGHLNNFELEPQGPLSQGQDPGILDVCEQLIKDSQKGIVVGCHEQIWLALNFFV